MKGWINGDTASSLVMGGISGIGLGRLRGAILGGF